jgi:hypothetical protein
MPMSIFQKVSNKFRAMRQRSRNKKEFLDSIIRAAEDGKLSDSEVTELQTRLKELELTDEDIRRVRVQAYNAALHAAKQEGGISSEEEAELEKLQKFLRIPDADIEISKKELLRLRLLTEIQNGNLPTVFVSNLVLQKAERIYWSEQGSLFEERVVRRRYEGGSHGVSFRIAKGVSYRVGAHRGQLVTDKAIIPVSAGDFIVTSKRVIFRGDTKSFNYKLDKLLDIHFYSDGVRVTDDKGKVRLVQFAEAANGDLVGAVLSQAINNYGA